MKTNTHDPRLKEAGERIRVARKSQYESLDKFADAITNNGCERPSTAKLSRIESGRQPTPPDILPAVSIITGLSFDEIRPDLAYLRKQAGASA